MKCNFHQCSFFTENMFYPVLGIKKTTNLYQKKVIKKKQTFLNLNCKNDMYKSQHVNKKFDDENLIQANPKQQYLKKQVI